MTKGIMTVIYPVKDLAKAKALYAALLGAPPTMDQPSHVGFDVDGQHIGLDPNGHSAGATGPVGYCHVDDINASLDVLIAAGATRHQDVKDVGGGKLIASATDAEGNVIGLIQAT